MKFFTPPNFPLLDRYLIATTLTNHPHANEGFNLAKNPNQSPEQRASIEANRQKLQSALPPNTTPLWLTQTHSDIIHTLKTYHPESPADALISYSREKMPIVLTADCIPALIADEQGEIWGAVHAGWQGVYQCILPKTIKAMQISPKRLWVYLAPSITQKNYEIDTPFYQRFINLDPSYEKAFTPNRPEHYLADLPHIAKLQLLEAGVPEKQIYQSALCSFEDTRLFSYRRDKALSGRMASFITPR
ncbi:MAG: peptidoglycan editing factor PgeF [Cardiobacteriaceae bacterium]|nr:peptidoglycan editing factor PgeF [Cardiobacteriaceae bacterium]